MSVTATADLIERVRAALAEEPNAMTMQLARRFAVPEAEVIRALPDGRGCELDAARWEEVIRALEDVGTVHVIVSNGATTMESVGKFGKFSTWGEFFNVQTPTLDMHIRWPNLGAIFAVEKPSHLNGVSTLSLQFYDSAGHAAFKVFFNFGGELKPERAEQFAALRERFRRG